MTSLDTLENALAAALGRPTFAPGLTDEEIDEALRPSGLVLPAEVRAYLRRHNGAAPSSRVLAPWLIGHWLPLSLCEAMTEREVRRAMASEDFGGEPDVADAAWGPGWLPLFRAGNGYILAIDCNAEPGADGRAAVLRMSRVTPAPPSIPSLEDLFDFFTLALTTGAWAWDEGRRRWVFDRARLVDHPFARLL
ncbi:SMI1/KNR4 family protein [Pseudonocardia sp. T1-2H]|uniref:SMI1/KNR4 family protein n=1 Tax=Pseudonocardia sp. T1-2H TaxID=3128899 RepID=UPI003100B2DD